MTNENTAQGTDEKKGPSIKTTIAGDYYSASITVDPGNNSALITHDLILTTLKDKNITVGVDLDVVDSIVQHPEAIQSVIIAKGKPHQNGRDGEIKYLVDIHREAKPKMLEDGSVDFI